MDQDKKQQESSQQWLTPEEVAGIMGVHINTVYNLLRDNRLRGSKVGPKTWRIKREEIDRYYESTANISLDDLK